MQCTRGEEKYGTTALKPVEGPWGTRSVKQGLDDEMIETKYTEAFGITRTRIERPVGRLSAFPLRRHDAAKKSVPFRNDADDLRRRVSLRGLGVGSCGEGELHTPTAFSL